ncbi:MAG: hypothetical protein A3C44_05225 [Gammaproteobacteria bacterium RIFCSPHIGHO2_02_FULL_39_13]|nr:MAG: hypothetical protein A3C44_05225 [Gammaproteobacteria bacterium RIFCSPHIGHO2_02_FULL_39_13]
MSLIDEALKKTQSSLKNTQRPHSVSTSESIVSRATATSAMHAGMIPNQFIKPRRTKKSFAFPNMTFNLHWIIFSVASIISISLIIFMLMHFHSITDRYVNFYSNLFSQHKTQRVITQPVMNETMPLTLSGTMRINNKRVALINGNLYRVGEVVNGYKVNAIQYDHVTLLNPQTHQIRTLVPELIQ